MISLYMVQEFSYTRSPFDPHLDPIYTLELVHQVENLGVTETDI